MVSERNMTSSHDSLLSVVIRPVVIYWVLCIFVVYLDFVSVLSLTSDVER